MSLKRRRKKRRDLNGSEHRSIEVDWMLTKTNYKCEIFINFTHWTFSFIPDLQEIRKILETETGGETCPSCHMPFDKGKKRKLIDNCGHGRCYSCMFKSEDCPLCQDSNFPAKNGKSAHLHAIWLLHLSSRIIYKIISWILMMASRMRFWLNRERKTNNKIHCCAVQTDYASSPKYVQLCTPCWRQSKSFPFFLLHFFFVSAGWWCIHIILAHTRTD